MVIVSLGGQVADQLGLVGLAARLEKGDSVVTIPFLAHELLVARHDLAHAGLNRRKVFGRERRIAGKIVIKPVFDGGPDRHLRAGIERLHRLGQHVRGVVADHAQRRLVAPRNKDDSGVIGNLARQIHVAAVDLHRQRRASQAGADGGGDFGARDRALETADRAVGQRD